MKNAGFVLVDVLIALFLWATGFSALYGLTEGAIQNSREALVMTEAANLAQNLLEQLSARPWTQNFTEGKCLPGSEVKGSEQGLQWSVKSEWESENVLLKVTAQVTWLKKGYPSTYTLTTLYCVQ
ncbi:type IV pilus modification PilV family protein [Desulfitobacterium sp. AusDCA]|uniref:type IV pilus modification PilV family protein n=1 Tax=Desulfitobacterium sp. AusDCA TaxID=3240383 RepID=UPI003DA745A3